MSGTNEPNEARIDMNYDEIYEHAHFHADGDLCFDEDCDVE